MSFQKGDAPDKRHTQEHHDNRGQNQNKPQKDADAANPAWSTQAPARAGVLHFIAETAEPARAEAFGPYESHLVLTLRTKCHWRAH